MTGARAGRAAEVLAERARVLARPLPGEEHDEGTEAVMFSIAGRRYAIAIDAVREVLTSLQISSLPWAPPAMAGVTNVRGDVIAVVDLPGLLGHGRASEDGQVMVLEHAGRRLGVLVDVVEEIETLDPGGLPHDTDPAGGGIVRAVNGAATVLDVAALFAHPQLTISTQEDR